MPSQGFIKRLKERRLGADFTKVGRLFQIFEPKTLKISLTVPHLIWPGYIKIQNVLFSYWLL